MRNYKPVRRYHRIDGWRGYYIPSNAIVGASDTGTWSDSPCPTPEVKAEIRRFQREVLRPLGIKSRQRFGTSSNVFCGKRWVCVRPASFAVAAIAVQKWRDSPSYRDYKFVHDADIEQCATEEV